MDLVSAAAWGSAHSDNKPPPRLPSLPGSLPSDGRSATATGFPAMAQRASPTFLLYSSANCPLPPVSFMAPTAGPAQRPGCPQSTTGLDFVVHFGGPSLQVLHCHKVSSIPSCYHLFKSSAEHPFTHVSWFTKHKQLLSACCILIHWEYGCPKHQTVSGSIRLYALFPKLFIMVIWTGKKKLEITQLLNHKGMVKQNMVFPLDRILPGH